MIYMEGCHLADLRYTAVFAAVVRSLNYELPKG